MMRCVRICIRKAVEVRLCLLAVLGALEKLDAPGAIRCRHIGTVDCQVFRILDVLK